MPAYLIPAFILVRRVATPEAALTEARAFTARANEQGGPALLFEDEALPLTEVVPEPELEVFPHSIVDVLPPRVIREALPEDEP